MTDSRKKSNRGDYEKEQEFNTMKYKWYSDPTSFYGKPEALYHPGNGLIGAKVSNMDLANNTVDIEGYLRGIGTANMLKHYVPPKPDIKYAKSLNLFENEVSMPEPLVVHRGQRPLPKS